MAVNKARHLLLCSAGSLEHPQERFLDLLAKLDEIFCLRPRNQGRLFSVIIVKYKNINKCFVVFQVLVQSSGISLSKIGLTADSLLSDLECIILKWLYILEEASGLSYLLAKSSFSLAFYANFTLLLGFRKSKNNNNKNRHAQKQNNLLPPPVPPTLQ